MKQPSSAIDRLHITIFGRRNSGKSSLLNAITNQDKALVSNVAGTTTDTVCKAMEIAALGACLVCDTPGFDDEGDLGQLRVERTLQAVDSTDIALLCFDGAATSVEAGWIDILKKRGIPYIAILNKIDVGSATKEVINDITNLCGDSPILVSTLTKEGIKDIFIAILRSLPSQFNAHSITGGLVNENDTVLLVMPQDESAPKGRLILPQVQTIRELLDKGATVICCTTDKIDNTLQALAKPPHLIITDSQVFDKVYARKPIESLLTSFSVLMAAYKGDIKEFICGAAAIDKLTPTSKVLIAEACTHAPQQEDIGRVKIPRMLRKKVGEDLTIDIVSGKDFPKDLDKYDLIIHCGGCMFNRKYLLSRIEKAKMSGTPITNYGVTIAHLNNIIDKIAIP